MTILLTGFLSGWLGYIFMCNDYKLLSAATFIAGAFLVYMSESLR